MASQAHLEVQVHIEVQAYKFAGIYRFLEENFQDRQPLLSLQKR